MKVSVTQQQLVGLLPAIQVIAGIKLSPNSKPAYSVRKNLTHINRAIMKFYGEQQKLYTDQGEMNKEKTQYLPPTDPEKLIEFNVALGALNNELIELDLFQIKVSELGADPIGQGIIVGLTDFMLTDDMVITDTGEVAPDTPKLSLVPSPANDAA